MFPAAKRILLPSWLLALWIIAAVWTCLPDASKNSVWKIFYNSLQTSLPKVIVLSVNQQDKIQISWQIASEQTYPVNYVDPTGRFGKAAFHGATQGDFYEPTNTAQAWGKGVGQFAAGLVPGYGQAADVRDFTAALNTARTEGLSFGTGVGVAMAGVAFVPGIGDVARSAVKPLLTAKSGAKTGTQALSNPAVKTETIQRWMSRAELEASQATGLLRGGREGIHYVTDAANTSAQRARQRLSLPQTPEVRATIEIPSGVFSLPSRVEPLFKMPGGGMERTATGEIPIKILKVD